MAKLKELHITVGKKELVLTPDEAKELKSVLEDLFGGNVEHHWHKTVERVRDHWPYRQWEIPMWKADQAATDGNTLYLQAKELGEGLYKERGEDG